jgi:hypothetical protein
VRRFLFDRLSAGAIEVDQLNNIVTRTGPAIEPIGKKGARVLVDGPRTVVTAWVVRLCWNDIAGIFQTSGPLPQSTSEPTVPPAESPEQGADPAPSAQGQSSSEPAPPAAQEPLSEKSKSPEPGSEIKPPAPPTNESGVELPPSTPKPLSRPASRAPRPGSAGFWLDELFPEEAWRSRKPPRVHRAIEQEINKRNAELARNAKPSEKVTLLEHVSLTAVRDEMNRRRER